MNKFLSIFLTSFHLVILLVSCSQDIIERGEKLHEVVSQPSAKILNSSEDSFSGELYVQVHEGEGLDIELFPSVTSCKPVFHGGFKNEQLAKELGLDRWYVVEFPKSENLDAMALNIAGSSAVQSIEFSNKLYNQHLGKATPYTSQSAAPTSSAHLSMFPTGVSSSPTFVEVSSSQMPIAEASAYTKAPSAQWSNFNDPLLVDQWHYYNLGDKSISTAAVAGADINLKDAWRLTTGDPRVIVAVIDEAVQYDHPDLVNNIWTNPNEKADGTDTDGNGYVDDLHGVNFATGGQLVWEGEKENSHGTHIAGTIAAMNDNGIGGCGIAGGDATHGGVKIMSCQVFYGGSASGLAMVNAFKYAADNGASIIQCSFGYNSGAINSDAEYKKSHSLELNAIEYFLKTSNCEAIDGGVAIFAAGNETSPKSGYPAAYYKYISVAAIAADNLPAYYTNYGPGVNISAPGGDVFTNSSVYNVRGQILSTLTSQASTTGYGYMNGTSMACPHVTGVAALGLSYMLQRGFKLSNEEFMSKILTSVNDIDDFLKNTRIGYDPKTNSVKTDIPMSPYKKNMGTGTIDAWRFLMQIEGVPSLTAKVGESKRIDLSDYFGGAAKNLEYLSCEMSEEDKRALGVTQEPEIKYGKLLITATKQGCAKVTIKAIGGGSTLGDGSNIGGMEMSRTISIIARSVKSDNNGWL